MPELLINGATHNIDLIVFDKDGTLVDFDLLWSGKLVRAVEAVVEAVLSVAPSSPQMKASLFATLGIDPRGMKVIPESPLAVSTLAKLGMATSVVLYQNGVSWHDAERVTREIFMPVIETLPRAQDIQAIGLVDALMANLRSRGFRLAIFTSDDRNATQATLPHLRIADAIEDMVCGDDGHCGKPIS
jgi:phosphoglycolate phosphatase